MIVTGMNFSRNVWIRGERIDIGSGNLVCDLLYFQGQSCAEEINESFLFIILDISVWEALS